MHNSIPSAVTVVRNGRVVRRHRWAQVGGLCLLGLAACGDADDGGAAAGMDPYRGWPRLRTAAPGRFRIDPIDGTWWFVTVEGNAFVSLGVNFVEPAGD